MRRAQIPEEEEGEGAVASRTLGGEEGGGGEELTQEMRPLRRSRWRPRGWPPVRRMRCAQFTEDEGEEEGRGQLPEEARLRPPCPFKTEGSAPLSLPPLPLWRSWDPILPVAEFSCKRLAAGTLASSAGLYGLGRAMLVFWILRLLGARGDEPAGQGGYALLDYSGLCTAPDGVWIHG